ncbi:MAG: PAS domain S-box protein [Desulfuromonadales bacterium]|nr:PAS domain S-box protein [Desulfuromonadales bacterium]
MDPTSHWQRNFLILGVAALLVGALLFGLHRHARQGALHLIARQQLLLTTQSAARIESRLQQVAANLSHLAGEIANPLADRELTARQIKFLFHTMPGNGLAGLLLIDTSGNLLIEYPPGALVKLNFPIHALGSAAPNPSPLIPVSCQQDCLLVLRQPVANEQQPAHYLAIVSLQKLVTESLRPVANQTDFCFLLDDSGTFRLHHRPELLAHPYMEVDWRTDRETFRSVNAFAQGDFALPYPPSLSLFAGNGPSGDRGNRAPLLTGAPLQVAGNRWVLGLSLPSAAMDAFAAGNDLFLVALGTLLLGSLLIAFRASHLLELPRLLKRERENRHLAMTRLQTALALTERRYQNLLNNAGDAIFFIDPTTGALLEVNRQAEDLLGYQATEIRNLSPTVLFPGRNHLRYLRLVARVLRSGYGEETNLVFRCKSGRRFTGAVHARLGDLGEHQVVHGVLRDVTEIKRIEQELRQKNRDLLLMNEIADHAAASRDLQEMLFPILNKVILGFGVEAGGLSVLEEETRQLRLISHYGISDEIRQEIETLELGEGLIGRVAVSGQSKSSVDLGKDERVASAAVRRAGWGSFQAISLTTNDRPVGVLFLFSRGKRVLSTTEISLLEAIGKQVGTAVAGANLFAALQRQVRLTQASNQDLEHSRQQLRDNLTTMEEANRALAQIDRMKSNFLALASHELRTPLTYILSGSELLTVQLGNRLQEGEARVLDAVYEGGKRLQTIVEDLLEVARIESRSLYLAREEINLPHLLQEVAQEFMPILAERQLSLDLGSHLRVPGLYGDPFHLKRTFRRLLENAVKFTPEGGWIAIRTCVQTRKELHRLEKRLHTFSPGFFTARPTGDLLQISICDNGVGIDPQDQIRVFEKFTEIGDISSHSTSRTRFGGKGVGLGLTLVKGMVEAHGGMVWVDSAGASQGGGSAFHILLPLGPATGIALEEPNALP